MPPFQELFQIFWKEKEEAKKTFEEHLKQNGKLLKEKQVWSEYFLFFIKLGILKINFSLYYLTQVVHHGVARDFYFQLSLLMSFSVSVYLSFSFSLSFSFYLTLCLTLSFSVSVYLSSLSHFLSFSLSLSLSHSLFIFLTLFLSLCLSISLSFSLFLCLSLIIVLTLSLFLTLCLFLFLKYPCSSKFCNKMLAATAPSWQQHIYYIDKRGCRFVAWEEDCLDYQKVNLLKSLSLKSLTQPIK